MAKSRFSRHEDDINNTEQAKKSGKLSSLAAKAKESIGSAAGNIKAVFSKEQSKASRTAKADTPYIPPEDTGEIPAAPAPAEMSAEASAPAPKRRFNSASQTDVPELTAAMPAEAPAPPVRSKPEKEASSLPSRTEAIGRDSDLYFSERMTDRGFKNKKLKEFEEKKTPVYQGPVVGLSKRAGDYDEQEHFYVPSMEIAEEDRRKRYKKRNRRPLKLWQKSVITGVSITAAFVGFIFLTISLMLIGKMNQINVKGSKDMNDLYFYEPTMVTSILDDSLSISENDRTRLSKLNDAFELSDLAVKSNKKVQNFLVVALDSRGNADGMIIISADEKTKKVRLVNILPDMYVPLSEQIDGINYGSSLRNIYAYGGAKLLRDSLQDTLKVKINYYFVLNFTAFETMVNHLGGANITITDEKLSLWMATNKFDPQTRFGGTGRFTLNGEEALIYSRMSQPDNAFARSLRQQELAAKLCERLSEYGTLEHVSVLYNTLSYVTTDCGAAKLLGLCGKAKKYGDYEVKGVTVPIAGTYTEGYVGGEYLLAANLTVNANDIQLFLYSNDMTYADGGTEVNVMLPALTEVLDVPEEPVSDTDLSGTDISASDA